MDSETSLISLEYYLDQEWQKLNSKEKALLLNYKRQLIGEMKIANQLIIKVNEVHEKYPDFHVGCIPDGDGVA